jgi:hypothetical protein
MFKLYSGYRDRVIKMADETEKTDEREAMRWLPTRVIG